MESNSGDGDRALVRPRHIGGSGGRGRGDTGHSRGVAPSQFRGVAIARSVGVGVISIERLVVVAIARSGSVGGGGMESIPGGGHSEPVGGAGVDHGGYSGGGDTSARGSVGGGGVESKMVRGSVVIRRCSISGFVGVVVVLDRALRGGGDRCPSGSS